MHGRIDESFMNEFYFNSTVTMTEPNLNCKMDETVLLSGIHACIIAGVVCVYDCKSKKDQDGPVPGCDVRINKKFCGYGTARRF